MPIKPLTREELHYAEVLFKLRVHESNGQAYENLFVNVVGKRIPGFKPIKPHGNVGDRKNDGYVASTGSYYQVYAPEDPSTKIADAIEKAAVDFNGLKQYWEKITPIKQYRFVFNDKFQGPYPIIEQTLNRIRQDHDLDVSECMLAKHLLDEFSLLDEQAMMQIVGLLPNPASLINLDFSVFADVIRHVMNNPITLNASVLLRVPDFDEKIRFNGISQRVGILLTNASYQAGAVLNFFRSNSSVSKTDIRNKLSDIYLHHKNKFDQSNLHLAGLQKGDAIFFAMLKDILPSNNPIAQNAAIVLMAHFFESCDIYEDPNLLT